MVASAALLGGRPVHAEQSALRVVSSFSILADLVRHVGADQVEVETLVGPNADVHVFEPRPIDTRRLANADLVVVNGLGFEGWLDRLVRASGYRGPVVVASAGLSPRDFGGQPDPHAWQDLTHGARYVGTIADAIANVRPSLTSICHANARDYVGRLRALDREIRARFEAIPRDRRRVMTSHDAFGYFGAAYGVDFISPLGMSTEGEPSAAVVAQLIRQIRDQRIRALFVENISDPRLVERIAHEAGVSAAGRLYSDALSAPGTEADTYLKLFAHNASVIATALRPK